MLIPHADLRRIVNDYLVSRGVRINILKIDYDYEYEQLCLDIVGEPHPAPTVQPGKLAFHFRNYADDAEGRIYMVHSVDEQSGYARCEWIVGPKGSNLFTLPLADLMSAT